MIRDNCSKIGYISKPHGKDGNVLIRLTGPFADDIEPGEPLFFEIEGTLVPFFIEEIRPMGDMAYVKFGFIGSETEAGKYRGCNLFGNPSLSGNPDFSLTGASLLEGFRIIDERSAFTGVIEEFADNPSNPLFLVRSDDKEVYIPVREELVIRLDRKKKVIYMNLPEGLTEL